MTQEISNSDDLIDIRDVIDRFEELEANGAAVDATDGDADENEEYRSLQALLNECDGKGGDHQWRGDWYPVTLIRESYFEEYAEQLASDIYGKEINSATWPFNCIDWERAANELRIDYTCVEFDGETYLTR